MSQEDWMASGGLCHLFEVQASHHKMGMKILPPHTVVVRLAIMGVGYA